MRLTTRLYGIAFEGNREFVVTINPSSLPVSVTIGNPGQATIAIAHNMIVSYLAIYVS